MGVTPLPHTPSKEGGYSRTTHPDVGRGILPYHTHPEVGRGILPYHTHPEVGRGLLPYHTHPEVGRGILPYHTHPEVGRGILPYHTHTEAFHASFRAFGASYVTLDPPFSKPWIRPWRRQSYRSNICIRLRADRYKFYPLIYIYNWMAHAVFICMAPDDACRSSKQPSWIDQLQLLHASYSHRLT